MTTTTDRPTYNELLDRVAELEARLAAQQHQKNNQILFNHSDLLYRITDNLFDLVAVTDLRGFFTFVSGSHRILGYQPEDLMNQHVLSCVHPDDKARVEQTLQHSIAHKKLGKIQYRCRKADGTYTWLETQGSFIDNDNGKPVSLLFSSRDISKSIEAGRAKESLYRNMFYEHKSVMLLIDPEDGRIVDANYSALEYYGYSYADITSMKIQDINVFSDQDIEREIQKAARDGKDHFQFRHQLADGEVRDVDVYCGKVEMQGNELLYSVIHDITSQKTAEKELLESEEKFRSFVQHSASLIRITDENYRICFINAAHQRVMNINIEDSYGMYIWDFLYENLPEALRSATSREKIKYKVKNFVAYTDDVATSMTFQNRLDSGETKHFTETVFKIRTARGIRVGSIVTDITRLKKAEQQLNRHLQHERSISKASTILLNNIDDAVNKALAHVLQASAASRIYIFENFQENDERCMRQISEVCASGVKSELQNPQLQRISYENDGFTRWAEKLANNEIVCGNVSSFPSEEQPVLKEQNIQSILIIPVWVNHQWWGFIGFDYVDETQTWDENDMGLLITIAEIFGVYFQNKQNEHTIREHNRQLKELNATKDRLFSIIGHDLKNPVNNIMGFSTLMARNFEQDKAYKNEKYVDLILQSVSQVAELLESLLTWSRTQSEKIDFNPEAFFIDNIIKNCIALMKPAAVNKQISIHYNEKPGLKGYADVKMITTVIRNLLSNAVKYSDQNGIIQIQTEQQKDNLVVHITDNGIGIPAHKLEQLFQIDTKYSSKGTAGEEGTGLGLIICKEFVEKNNGKIWVNSEQGRGSTFSFCIPAARNRKG